MKWEIVQKASYANSFTPCPACGTVVSIFPGCGLEEVADGYFKCKACYSLLRKVDEVEQ